MKTSFTLRWRPWLLLLCSSLLWGTLSWGQCSSSVNPINSLTVCTGSIVAPISFNGTAARYQWSNSNPAIGLAASGIGNLSSFTAINSSPTNQTALITVTPQSVPSDLLYVSTYRGGVVNPSLSPATVEVYDPVSNSIVNSIQTQSSNTVCVSADGSRVYMANQNNNSISVINTATNAVIATIPVGAQPVGVSVSPNGRVYVTKNSSNTVSVIDPVTNTVSTTVGVGDAPIGVSVSPDGSRVYVANSDFYHNTVSVIDAAANTVIATVGVGFTPVGVCVSPDGSRVYVTNISSNHVSVINTATNTVMATIQVWNSPVGVSVSPDGSRVYVTNSSSNKVSVINALTNTVTATIDVGTSPNGVSVSSDGSRVYVFNEVSNNMSVINAVTNTVVNTINFPNAIANNRGNFVAPVRCSGAPMSFTITVPPTPILTTSIPTLTCANPTATLTATGGDTYSFSGPVILTSSPTSGTAFVNAAGSYSVIVTITSGCTALATTTITSNTVLTVSAGASLSMANLGGIVSLTASGASSYQWSAPTTALLTSPSVDSAVSAQLTTAGLQTFTVVGTSGACSQSALVSVMALASPDLSPIINMPDANFPAGGSKALLVQIFEINGYLSSGNIVITLTVPTGYSVSFDNTITSFTVSGVTPNPVVSVDNPKWYQTSTMGTQQLNITINGGQSIGANSAMNLGFIINRTNANSGSVASITVNVADDISGGYDVNRLNNVYARIITGL